jgi:hypothetical protein
MMNIKLILAKSQRPEISPFGRTRRLDNEEADIGRFRLVTAIQARNLLDRLFKFPMFDDINLTDPLSLFNRKCVSIWSLQYLR